MSLVISISGIRGVIGESLTPELLLRFAAAFGTFMKSGEIVVARDTRVSGAMIKHCVFAGLMSSGCHIIDLDMCTTPSCSLMVEELGADGAVVISGSHNPIQWNALKFLRSDGIYLNENQAKQLLDIYYQGNFRKVRWDKLKVVEPNNSTESIHKAAVIKNVDAKAIRNKKFKVVIDSCNGAGSLITPKLLEELGCEVIKIHCEPNGLFPHNPEPLFANLQDLCDAVREHHADVGFAQDADADRFAIVDEKGNYLGEEYSLALATYHILKRKAGPVVTNLSTTRAVEDVARRFNSDFYRTRVGEVNVAEKMKETKSVIGGEGNGGVIYPDLHYVRDSIIGIALILQLLAQEDKPVSEIVKEIPCYHMKKVKVSCSRDVAYELIEQYKKQTSDGRVSEEDGLRIDWEDSWIHIRPSGTEPAVRIIGEAKTAEKIEALCNEVKLLAEKIIS